MFLHNTSTLKKVLKKNYSFPLSEFNLKFSTEKDWIRY